MKTTTEKTGLFDKVLNFINLSEFTNTTPQNIAECFKMSVDAAGIILKELHKKGLISKHGDNYRAFSEYEKEQNDPRYLFQTVSAVVLAKAARGEFDLLAQAKKELANRGLDQYGIWVGFQKAKEIHGIK